MLTPVEIDILIKIIIAAVLGGIIGFERELHKKPGDLRMHALVCMGAALFTTISMTIFSSPAIAAGIVSGIGFLCAGIIFKGSDENQVHGLTTAAEVWVVGAIGITVGIGFFAVAIIAALFVLIILGPLKGFEQNAIRKRQKR